MNRSSFRCSSYSILSPSISISMTCAIHNMGNKGIYRIATTKNRIACNCHSRVRKNCYFQSSRRIRLTSTYILADNRIISKCVCIAVNICRLVNKHTIAHTNNFNTITIPSIGISNIVHSIGCMSIQFNLATITNSSMIHLNCYLRIINSLHFYFCRVFTATCGLSSNEIVGYIRSNGVNRCIAPLSGAMNHIIIAYSALIPLVRKTRNINIVDSRCKSYLSTVANCNDRIQESNNRSFMNIDSKCVTCYRTTTNTICNRYIIDVC